MHIRRRGVGGVRIVCSVYHVFYLYMFDYVFHIIRAMEVLVFSLWFSEVYIHTCHIDHTQWICIRRTSDSIKVYISP